MESGPSGPEKPKGSPLAALLIGFTPAAILLAVFSGTGQKLQSDELNVFLWVACISSITCCVVSSALLFRRGTGGAIAGALLLMLMNCFIAFFFGCCASLVM